MHFIKMHGINNDYIYFDAYNVPDLESHFDGDHGRRLIRAMSHRHAGIGSDGVILVCRPLDAANAHVRMRMFNADGSESEMCGNGVRCVAKFAHDRLGVRAEPMHIETGRGVLSIDYRVVEGKLVDATVDMGEPILDAAEIPVRLAGQPGNGRVIDRPVPATPAWAAIAGGTTRLLPAITCVSMGNPHCVMFGELPDENQMRIIGPLVEHDPIFPSRTNFHAVDVLQPNHARMITWERGAGTTQACGTGACAVLVAGVLTGRLEREADIELPGGELHVVWDAPTNHVFMTGPAEDVFEGEWPDY